MFKALALITSAVAIIGATMAITSTPAESYSMPDESHPHERTWIAMRADEEIWGDVADDVFKVLAKLANKISEYEPVSVLVTPEDKAQAEELLDDSIRIEVTQLDDLWIRDTGPTFVKRASDGHLVGLDFNFNGWGKKQTHDHDADVAEFVTIKADAVHLDSGLVLEGGGVEVDGDGTAIISESCVVNKNRNPGMTRSQIEAKLKPMLGVKKIIWIPGIKGKDITDGHTDFYARFAGPGVVIASYDPDPDSFDHAVTKKHLAILRQATDAKGRKLKVVILQGPTKVRKTFESDEFAAGYIGYYVGNNAVFMQEFGDKKADSAAKATLAKLFPDRDIVQLNMDPIASGGGSIHCATQQQPKMTEN